MSKETENDDLQNALAGETEQVLTPLEQVKEQQAMQQQNREVAEQRPEHNPEVPGASNPSNKRKHPQRQLYDGKS